MSTYRVPIVLPSLDSLRQEGQLDSEPPAVFLKALHDSGIEPALGARLCGYVALLTSSNKLLNLTALKDREAVWMTLVFDALQLTPEYAGFAEGTNVLDVGCGGGLPGVPLAIAFPQLSFTLLDATQKKIDFIAHVKRELGLSNLHAICGRAEELGKVFNDVRPEGNLRETFDVVSARALARLPTLLELTTPFVKPAKKKGVCNVIYVKGEQFQDELAEAKEALFKLRTQYLGAREHATGRVLCLSKHARTPPNFPRANGVPRKQPL